MTKFENMLFDFNEKVFGIAVAVKFFCFCSDAFTALMYILYLTTLPYRFVELTITNYKKYSKEGKPTQFN